MLLVYENRTDGIVVEWKKTVHFPPHLHEAIEVVYVTDGDIELGVGQELYHMDEGDFAIVFPNVMVLCQDLVQVKMRNFSPF